MCWEWLKKTFRPTGDEHVETGLGAAFSDGFGVGAVGRSVCTSCRFWIHAIKKRVRAYDEHHRLQMKRRRDKSSEYLLRRAGCWL